MNINKFITRLAVGVTLCVSSLTHAAGFPERAVTIVVPYPAGGTTEVLY